MSMPDERYKALMDSVGMPNSRSLLQALRQAVNETEQDLEAKRKEEIDEVQAEYQNVIDANEEDHEQSLEEMARSYGILIKQARKETRQQCADSLDEYLLKSGKGLQAKQRDIILNSGKG